MVETGVTMRNFRLLFSPLLFCRLLLVAGLVLTAGLSHGQQQLLENRWLQVNTEHFSIISQTSSRQSTRFADQLETWRQIAASIINGESPFPAAQIPNYVYLFDDTESFQQFSVGEELAFFYPTPRANFMAFVVDDENSVTEAFHHYAHFLLRNFSDLRLPRWYEEGLAAYLARMQINRGVAEFERFSQRDQELMAEISGSLSMDRLLYRDEALASPRLIQIANLKSESLLHYLLHAHEEDQFVDRRPQLRSYLQLLLEGRNPRFAYDRSFDVTTEQLDEEFQYYLLNSSRPAGIIEHAAVTENPDYDAQRLQAAGLAVVLGELALNSGRSENAQLFFQAAIGSGEEIARGYSGLGDALRFQDLPDRDQEIARYFEMAVERAPNDPNILMDFGEYWESELADCDKSYPESQRRSLIAEIKNKFEQALALVPDSPEANLAMGQYFLVDGEDWRQGVEYQTKAFALLPADGFIMEQAIKYAIAADEYEEAERLISEMAQPIHFYGEPGYVTDLRLRLLKKRRNEIYDACAQD